MGKILEKYRANILTEVDFRLGTGVDLAGNSTISVTNTSGRFEKSNRGRCFNTGGDSYWTATGSDWDTAQTIGVWAKIPPTLNANNRFISNGANGSVGWTLNTQSGGAYIIADGFSAPNVQETAIGFAAKADTWYFFVATINVATHTVVPFVDGVKYASTQATSTISVNGNSSIGARGDGSFIYPGCIRRAVVIDQTLTDAEIAQWYEEEKQQAHYDRVDIQNLSDPARNLLTDGDMETAGTSAWTAGASSTISKQTGTPHGGLQVLRIAYNGGNPSARQVILATDKLYRVTGYARTGAAATIVPRVYLGNNNPWIGTTSTSWQYFDFVARTGATNPTWFQLYGWSAAAGEYVEFDDVKVQEVPNVDPVYIADGMGWNESLANETAGFLSNTGLTIKSGTWKVEDNGDGTKKTSNIASGILSKPCTQAEGTWEFDLFHAAATETRLYFMASSTDAHTVAGQTGYMFSVLGTERLALHRNNGDTTSTTLFQTDTGYVAEDAWVSYKVTKSGSTITSYFSTDNRQTWTEIAESSGNNPATDATYTSSNYWVLNLGTADAARNFNFTPIIN